MLVKSVRVVVSESNVRELQDGTGIMGWEGGTGVVPLVQYLDIVRMMMTAGNQRAFMRFRPRACHP